MGRLDLGQAEFLFRSDAFAETALRVYHFRGRESLSQPFEFQIELVADDPNLDLDKPVGEVARLTLVGRLADGGRYERHVHGVIERFVQTSARLRHSRYQATLVPMVKQLHYTRNSRIFQKASAPDVTQQILQDGQIPSGAVNAMLHGVYGARDYCVQYQESDLAFVQRLWEEEGIFYFFEHEKDGDKLALGDGGHAFASLPNYAEVRLRDAPHLYEEGLATFSSESALRPGAAVLRDFKFKQPSLDMDAKADGGRFANRKMYYSPGEYNDPKIGQQLAKVRLEELQCQRSLCVGTGNVRAMLPGYKFTLTGHRRRDCNQEYLISAIEHEGTQPQALDEEAPVSEKTTYQNRLECIPASVAYRPSRQTPTPSIAGVQTALVVGPPGEEIHCDEYGRVKVKFHWDLDPGRDDNSSCWVRVSQGSAGVGYGSQFIPRCGHEVLVQFLAGDPDRPVVTGRVYDGENPPPYELPQHKTRSAIKTLSSPGGGGFNELRFEDQAGSEEIFLHAQKDFNEVINNNHTTSVGANQSISVGVNQSTSVGANQSTSVGANQSTSVSINQSTAVGADQSIYVGGNQSEVIQQSQTLTVVEGDQNIAVQTGLSSLTVMQDRLVTVQSGDHVVTVETGDSLHTVNTGDLTLSVLTGDSSLQVNTGNHTTTVLTGDHSVQVNTGNSSISMLSGGHTTSALQAVDISSTASSLSVKAATGWTGHGGVTASLDAPDITITAVKSLTLQCGTSKITLTPSQILLSAGCANLTIEGSITAAANGGGKLVLTADAELHGGEVKLNA